MSANDRTPENPRGGAGKVPREVHIRRHRWFLSLFILGAGRSDIFLFPPTPALPHQGGGRNKAPSPTRGEGETRPPPPPGGREKQGPLPHQGGGRNKAPSPTRGEGETRLPPPPGGREKQGSLPHQGGGRNKAPSPLVGEGETRPPPPWWGRVGVGGRIVPNSTVPSIRECSPGPGR